MKWNVLKYTKVGRRNMNNGLLCQDYVYHKRKGDIQVITLADGTGENDFARMGAKHSCKILAELLVEYFDELYDMEDEVVQFNVITNIQTELYKLCKEHEIALECLRSTALGIAIDDKRDIFMAIHLGDGSIGIKKNGKFITVSYPQNGANKSQTYLTSVHRVGKEIKVIKNHIRDIQKFILVSDGWNEKMGGETGFIQEELLQKAEESEYTDDVSFIALEKSECYN